MNRFGVFFLAQWALFAIPQSPTIITGDASLKNSSEGILEIITSDKSFIEWKDFSIEVGETVRFIQPHQTASVINRVTEAYPSRIFGNLESNSQVLLINPNGILVGKDSQINTGSFIASTLDLQCQDLSREVMLFKGISSASLIIEGKITASGGVLALIAGKISQRGALKAAEVQILAGSEVQLGTYDTKISSPVSFLEDLYLISHEGSINASRVGICAFTDTMRTSIHLSGSIKAEGTSDPFVLIYAQNGINWIDGPISSIGHVSGGVINLLGERVGLGERAYVDANGEQGGGLIHIGGDYRGGNREEIPAAKDIYISSLANITSSALSAGNGGRIILWGDESNLTYGKISARGGPISGHGGFVELSAPTLDFQTFPDVGAPNGQGGTVLLDPTNVLITANSSAPGLVIDNPTTWTNLTAPSNPLQIRGTGAGSISTALATGNVIIDTSDGFNFGAAGNITVDSVAGSQITWTSNNQLTLAADGDILILRSIECNTGIGGVTLRQKATAPSTHFIQIGDHVRTPGIGQGVSVGSQFGVTTVDAPFADLIIQGGNAANLLWGQLGFSAAPPPAAQVVGGAIFVDCNNLLIEAGTGDSCPAVIGQGYPSTSGPALSLTVNCPITIRTAANIIMRGVSGAVPMSGSINVIGHGIEDLFGLGITSTLNGDIDIVCEGALSMIVNQGNNPADTPPANLIGHGQIRNLFRGNITGNISVVTGGNITLGYTVNPTAGALNMIGHAAFADGAVGFGVTGDVFVSSLGNITLSNAGTPSGGNLIGNGFVRSPGIATSNLTVIAEGNININSGDAATTNASIITTNTIGQAGLTGSLPATSQYNGDVRVIAGCSINMSYHSTNTIQLGNMINIGVQSTNPLATSNTFVAAGMDISIFKYGIGPVPPTGVASCGIVGVNDVNVIALNDILLSSAQNTAAGAQGLAFIGPSQYQRGGTTRVFAGRDIICSNNGTLANQAVIGQSTTVPVAVANTSVIIRAAGDVQIAANIFSGFGTSGNIFIEADAIFAAGDLISYNGLNLNTIAGINVAGAVAPPAPVVIPFALTLPNPGCTTCTSAVCDTPTCITVSSCRTCCGALCGGVCPAACTDPVCCPLCTSCFSPPCPAFATIGVSSVAIPADLLGAVRINKGVAAELTLRTTSGNITIHSASLRRDGIIFQDLTLSNVAAATNLNLVTISGNINISGSVGSDSFRDIFINTPLTTTGSIYVRANRNFNVNAAVSSTGINPVSLLAGNTTIPGGTLTLTSNVSSSGGDVLVQAGGGAVCSILSHNSSVNQTAGTISTNGIGNVTISADLNINLLSPTSINAASGNVHTLAGNDTTLINTTITKTAGGGDLLMISGHNMNMANSQILAAFSFVTLVVDNCFPAPPFIGPGAFSLDSSSSINASNLRIFTALQSLNLINGLLNINGNTFFPGTLYQDSPTEHWCQYFGFPFPYPFSMLGNAPLYTIFYKDCLQQATEQAQIIVTESLVDLHPYNEFPGWRNEFWIEYQKATHLLKGNVGSLIKLNNEPYYFRRRHLSMFNHPKTWTVLED